MLKYANLSGISGVTAYEFTAGGIKVTFQDGSTYLYTERSAGRHNITVMIECARAGRGLNSYINMNVRKLYEAKL